MLTTNQSIWKASSQRGQEYPSLQQNIETDILIIGGGISGMACAALLAKSGKSITLIEGRKIGEGATGNSTGNLYVTVDQHLQEINKKWGLEKTRQLVAARAEGIAEIQKICREYNIACDFTPCSLHLYSEKRNPDELEFLEKELAVMKECGLKATIQDIKIGASTRATSLVLEDQAQFHPLSFVRQLAAGLPKNCTIYEDSRITDYDAGTGVYKTEYAEIKAGQTILATHSPIGLFAVHTVLAPYREYGVAANLKEAGPGPGIYWSCGKVKHSVREVKTEDKTYILTIGDRFKTGQGISNPHYLLELETYLNRHFKVDKVDHAWAAQQYKPADHLPYLGRHSDSLHMLTGFSADGLVYGVLGAMIIADDILGRKNRWASMFDPQRHTPLKSAHNFIKENLNSFKQYKDLLPGRLAHAYLAELLPGEGQIMEIAGEKLAVYKDEKGNCCACSALCTHLQCVVHWNTVEKTWDCPCHGSRFSSNGAVIEGPALRNLPGKEIQ